MASLREAIKAHQEELQSGDAWVAFWKEGRSWHSEAFHLDMGATLYPEDEWRLREIEAADPAAIVLNGYLSEDMTLDELTTSIRYHYEHRMNGITGFITEYSNRLSTEEIEKGRAAARAAGLPFSEKPFRDGEDFDPYVYDGSMSVEDYELMQRMIENERSERMDEPIISGYLSNAENTAGEWVSFPTTAEQMRETADRIGIDFHNRKTWYFREYQSAIPGMTENFDRQESPDELNYLGRLLSMQFDDDREKFMAAVTLGDHVSSVKELINLAQNLECYWIYPQIRTEEQYAHYLLEELGEIELPEKAEKYFLYKEYGRDAVKDDGGKFTEQGYIYNNLKYNERGVFTQWYDGKRVPKEYRVTPTPTVPGRPDPEKVEMDAAPAGQNAAQPKEQAQEPRPVISIILTSEKPADKLKEITDRLEQGITELFESERYKEYLRVMSKFHNYSFNNTLLIAMQKPDASLVAGFSSWKNNFGRSVIKGEKGIKIIAPSPFTVKQEVEKTDPQTGKPVIGKDGKPVTEEKEIKVPAYKVVSVFDVSQTEGRELPDIAVNELTGDVDRFKDFFSALEQASPVPVGFEKIEGGARGYYHLEEKRIAIDEGMSDLQTLKTAIHEIAHAKLHDIDLNAPKEEQKPRVDRRTREVEAESVAYTVCQHYGLDTSDYSFGYVAGWSSGKELAELRGSLETIRSTAAEMINSIDGHFAELQKVQEKEKAQPQHEGNTPAQKSETQAKDAPREKAAMPEYIYKIETNPRSDSRENLSFLQAYLPQGDGTAAIGDVLYIGTPEKCRELLGQLNAGELTEGQVKELYAKAQEQPGTGRDDTFSIYQLKDGDETRDYRFEPYDRLQAAGLAVDRANYELVYTAPLVPGTSLDDIFTRFNIDHPKDFKGHSLSVSDVVVLHQDGQDTAHYVDRGDFKQIPEFLQEKQPQRENPLKAAEQTTEQNYNMIDGRINNTPTVDELEAKVKAGETISLVDLANAVKADKERGKAAQPEKKPSIRAQLKADKERAAQKKPAKQKSQGLERS